jgi:hypothetical protein
MVFKCRSCDAEASSWQSHENAMAVGVLMNWGTRGYYIWFVMIGVTDNLRCMTYLKGDRRVLNILRVAACAIYNPFKGRSASCEIY